MIWFTYISQRGDYMENDKLVCQSCGNDAFAQGELGGAYTNVRPVDAFFLVRH